MINSTSFSFQGFLTWHYFFSFMKMKLVVLTGRIFYSLIFINSGLFHFSKAAIDYADSQGVPMPSFLVPVSGIMAVAGGLSILIGYKAKWGAWLLVAFLIPVTIMMHGFWKFNEAAQHQVQMAMFMKNTSMLGAALLITWFGSGPISLDAKKEENMPD
jgi:putative oxidoreductase